MSDTPSPRFVLPWNTSPSESPSSVRPLSSLPSVTFQWLCYKDDACSDSSDGDSFDWPRSPPSDSSTLNSSISDPPPTPSWLWSTGPWTGSRPASPVDEDADDDSSDGEYTHPDDQRLVVYRDHRGDVLHLAFAYDLEAAHDRFAAQPLARVPCGCRWCRRRGGPQLPASRDRDARAVLAVRIVLGLCLLAVVLAGSFGWAVAIPADLGLGSGRGGSHLPAHP